MTYIGTRRQPNVRTTKSLPAGIKAKDFQFGGTQNTYIAEFAWRQSFHIKKQTTLHIITFRMYNASTKNIQIESTQCVCGR